MRNQGQIDKTLPVLLKVHLMSRKHQFDYKTQALVRRDIGKPRT